MNVELQINNTTDANARFVTWAPSLCQIRMTDSTGATVSPTPITLSVVTRATSGDVEFSATAAGPFAANLQLQVPTNGSSVKLFVRGQFGQPSTNRDDVTIVARAGTAKVGSVDLMVRIRKDANTLTPAERDRFIAAFAQLNNQGLGQFTDFRDMHTAASINQAHGDAGFLPWHRAYILDLERELQGIDPSVALPYWRFDQPAPNVFTRDFMGVPDALGRLQFSPNNPLQFWVTDGVPGMDRKPYFNTATASALIGNNEAATIALCAAYIDFCGPMEGDPHGTAHTSFDGPIDSVPTAARDPLFFLLHCNVDRLWAKWQQVNNRFDPADPAAFDSSIVHPQGHNLTDTMWPWDGDTVPPRPPTAPGGTMVPSPCVAGPGPSPMVENCLDYLGSVAFAACMGYSYDDVAP